MPINAAPYRLDDGKKSSLPLSVLKHVCHIRLPSHVDATASKQAEASLVKENALDVILLENFMPSSSR